LRENSCSSRHIFRLFSERMSQAGCLCGAEKSMKVHFSCNSIYFGRLSKEVASTGNKTYAEMSLDEKNLTSMRRKALDGFKNYLDLNFEL